MFVRIVKMGFHAKEVKGFLATFHAKKEHIRNTKGCQLLELYQDKNDRTVFFTYSYWEREIDLENYRKSALFRSVWAETKTRFNKKPEAWSVDKTIVLN